MLSAKGSKGQNMRILNDKDDTRLDRVMIFLTPEELLELKGGIECMLENRECTHIHLDDYGYIHEVTIARYGDGTEKEYSKRVVELIEYDR